MPEKEIPSFLKNVELPPEVEAVVRAVSAAGGKALLVGGYVRDLVRGKVSKDIDIEVHGLPLDELEKVLAGFGPVDLVGKQFGVLRLHGVDVDWSVPRRDSRGRHPQVEPDPFMGVEEAARRRDLTVNAMALDPLDGTLFDPFGGLEDLNRKVLRPPDPVLFEEDPLRFFRVMSFAGYLEMDVDSSLTRLCAKMDLEDIARERIDEEFNRLFLSSRRPSIGLRWLEEAGRLAEVLPEAAALVGLEQDPKWHPEGDAWQHTLQVVDAAAGLRIIDKEQDLMLLWAALCHDLGKAQTTNNEDGRIRSKGHTDIAGELTERLVSRYESIARVRKGAAKLAEHHLKPHDFHVNKASPKAFKRLALALAPETNLERLAALALADYRGRNPDGDEPLDVASETCEWFLRQAEELKVKREPEAPVLKGRHLLDEVQPGPAMGRLLKRAYELQLTEGIKDVETLKARVLGEKKE